MDLTEKRSTGFVYCIIYTLRQNCLFDACAYNNIEMAMANNVAAYVKSCQDLGGDVCPTWRNDANIRK